MHASQQTVIDELRLDIGNHEAQIRKNQGVYDDFVDKMKAQLEQRINEVKDVVEILP
jgi:hypothetical protein